MSSAAFDHLIPEQLYELAAQLTQRVASLNKQVDYHKARSEQLAHENGHPFARRSEQLDANQPSLLDELVDTDIAAIEAELEELAPVPAPVEPRR